MKGYIRVEVERLPKRPGDGPAAPGPNNTPSHPGDKSAGPPGPGTGGTAGQQQIDPGAQGGQHTGNEGRAMDVDMASREDEPEDSMPDTSIDTETWNQLGIKELALDEGKENAEPGALAISDTAGSSPPPSRALVGAFNMVGSASLPAAGRADAVGCAAATLAPASPSLLGSDSGVVLNEPSIRTPMSSRRSSGGSGRAPKKSAGRKPPVKQAALALPSPVAPACVDL